ncbi:MAG: hypothetical protein WBQ61_12040 [Candidatus Acidiferrum sp.]
MIESDSDTVRRIHVRQLFKARPADERNELGVDLFYAWLEKRHPELLIWGLEDPHERSRGELERLYE